LCGTCWKEANWNKLHATVNGISSSWMHCERSDMSYSSTVAVSVHGSKECSVKSWVCRAVSSGEPVITASVGSAQCRTRVWLVVGIVRCVVLNLISTELVCDLRQSEKCKV
jgi:hypothetical protein